MPKPKKVVSATKEDNYDVVFHIGPEKYQATGDSILSALQKIKPTKYMGLCKVEVTKDGKMSRLPLTLVPTNLKRIFAKPVDLALLAKRLETLL